MRHSINSIIKTNVSRQDVISLAINSYNPSLGKCCSGKRKIFGNYYLPLSFIRSRHFNKENPNSNREKYDFEYWYSVYYGKTPTLAQRRVINQLENLRSKNKIESSKLIILHATQLGISTLCTIYIYWLQFINGNCRDAIFYYKLASDRNEAKYKFKNYPNQYNLTCHNIKHQSTNTLNINDYAATNAYFTTVNPFMARNYSPNYVLFSDAAKCVSVLPRTLIYNDKLKLSYQAALPSQSDGLLIMESNPDTRHTQGFFYDTFRSSSNKQLYRSFSSIFLPWHASEKNILKLNSSVIDFYNSLSSYESYLWRKLKLSLEQINWYRHNTKGIDNPAKLYPSTIDEALTHKIFASSKKTSKVKYPKPISKKKIKCPRKPKRVPKYEWIFYIEDYAQSYYPSQNINTIPTAPPG